MNLVPCTNENADSQPKNEAVRIEWEDRFIAIGPISRGLVLIVWTERDEDIIRIISARWATKKETALFNSYMKDLK